MNTLLLTVFMNLNPNYGATSPMIQKAMTQDQVRYNYFNRNFQVTIKLRFDGKKRRDGLRISF